GPPIVFPLLVLEDADLLVTTMLDDYPHDPRRGDQGRAHAGLPFAADEQDVLELNRLAHIGGQTLHMDRVASLHSVLFAATSHDRVHGCSLLRRPVETRKTITHRRRASNRGTPDPSGRGQSWSC